MLETVREFGLEQLVASGEEVPVRDRHGDWCLRVAERADAAAWGPQQRTAFDFLEANYDNIRAALGWFLDRGDVRGLHLATKMDAFWYVRGPIREASAWLDRALAIAATDQTPLALRARLHFVAGRAAGRRWDKERSEKLLSESITLFGAAGDERGMAEACIIRLIAIPTDEETFAEMERALRVIRPLNSPITPFALMDLGIHAHDRGDSDRGLALLNEGFDLLVASGNAWGMGARLFPLFGADVETRRQETGGRACPGRTR